MLSPRCCRRALTGGCAASRGGLESLRGARNAGEARAESINQALKLSSWASSPYVGIADVPICLVTVTAARPLARHQPKW